jgi:hypothetical protein
MHQTHPASRNAATKHASVAGFIRFIVMAIALLIPANAIGRLFYAALGQVPGTTAWHYGLWGGAGLNIMAIAAIVAPQKVSQTGGLIPIIQISLCTTTTYCAAFAHGTIGLMALSVGHRWGGGWLMIGLIYLVGAVNLLLRLVRQYRNPSIMRQIG